MASTFFGLNIAKTGLYAYQIGINTSAHNVSNAETKGYSRQEVYKQAGIPLSGTSYGMIGTGVVVTGIEQIRSQYLDEKFRFNETLANNYATKSFYMEEVQSYFNEITVQGFTTNFDNFYKALQTLSTNPSSGTTRTQVATYGQSLTEFLNSLGKNLQMIQKDCNTEVKNTVDRINSIGEQLSELTVQINSVEINGESANDLRDQRNLLVDELSKYVSVEVEEKIVGDSDVGVNRYTVKINGQTLVDTNQYNLLKLTVREDRIDCLDVDGLYDIVWESGVTFNAMATNVSGSLKAALEVRDGNNKEVLTGKLTGTAGSKTVTLTNANINDINKLNIGDSGVITVGAKEYRYSSFSIQQTATGYTYTFELEEGLKESTTDKTIATVGTAVDYKGIPYYMSQLNEFVRVYAQRFNDIHKSGQDMNEETGLDFFVGVDASGNQITFNKKNDVTNPVYDSSNPEAGKSYFRLNINNIRVNKTIVSDPNKVVTYSDKTNGVENTDVLSQLIALKADTGMFRQGSPASFFQTMVAEIGVNTGTAEQLAKNQANIVSSIQTQRYSVSGVDMDEEAMNMVKFQNYYNLSCKMLSVMDEMLDRLINQTAR